MTILFLRELDEQSRKKVTESIMTVRSIEIGAIGGNIELSTVLTSGDQSNLIDPYDYYIFRITDNSPNKIYLIMKDGSTLPANVSGCSSSNNDGLLTSSWEICYGSNSAVKEIIDIDNVTDISLNGVVYELK
ncbi:MAG: hypothetical protein NC078_07310 [Ruminococcus sp.]|nr:hypothetical protein [Ruminococcus sp.]